MVGHDHLWTMCCWYSVMAGSTSVCQNALLCACARDKFVKTRMMGFVCEDKILEARLSQP